MILEAPIPELHPEGVKTPEGRFPLQQNGETEILEMGGGPRTTHGQPLPHRGWRRTHQC